MKKRLLSILITVIALVPFILSAFAFSDNEALVRKRAYYAGIENSLSLLSQNLGALENVQIQKIVVTSPEDLTTETAVKEFIVKESQKSFSLFPAPVLSMSISSFRLLKTEFSRTIFGIMLFLMVPSTILFP